MEPGTYETAKGIFKDTNLNITKECKSHLGVIVGTDEFRKKCAIMRVNEWVTELMLRTKIAKFYLQLHIHIRFFDKSSSTLFEPYPASGIYYKPWKISFNQSL